MTRPSYLVPRFENGTRADPQEDESIFLYWHRLGLSTWPGFDHVVPEYTAETLTAAAGVIERDAPLADADLSGAAVAALRDLAADLPALNKLNRRREVAPASMRALNVAVHYLTVYELHGKSDAAFKQVADAWEIPEATIKDMFGTRRADASGELEKLITHCLAHRGFTTRRDVLDAIEADMRWRAAVLPKPAPHKARGVDESE